MDCGKGNASVGKLLYRKTDGFGDVVEFQIKHYFTSTRHNRIHHRPTSSKEELQSHLEKINLPGETCNKIFCILPIVDIKSKNNSFI